VAGRVSKTGGMALLLTHLKVNLEDKDI
jgi:hypothetical protein